MIKVTSHTIGFEAVAQRLASMQRQIPFAMARSINKLATLIAEEENKEIARVFDRPNPRTLRAVKVFKGAKKNDLEAIVNVDNGLRGSAQAAAMGTTGKSVPPSKYLHAQIVGGQRVIKRYERALQRAGVMPSGVYGVFCRRSNALDQYGNLQGSKIVQILSWFQAYPDNGYRINMTKKTKMRLMQGKRKGLRYGFGYFRGGRRTGLPDGIWERHYPNGLSGKSFIRPIILYVKSANYGERFDFYGIADRTLKRNMGWVIDEVIATTIKTAR